MMKRDVLSLGAPFLKQEGSSIRVTMKNPCKIRDASAVRFLSQIPPTIARIKVMTVIAAITVIAVMRSIERSGILGFLAVFFWWLII